MSKSLGNYIGVAEPAEEIYGKVMSIPDSIMIDYFELLTDVPDEELKQFRQALKKDKVNPMEIKKRLAREIIGQLYDKKATAKAEGHFVKTIQKKELPDIIPEIKFTKELLAKIQKKQPFIEMGTVGASDHHLEGYFVSTPLLLVEVGLVKSRSEARRLIQQGAVDVDDNTIVDDYCKINVGSVIKVGKRRFAKVVNSDIIK